MNLIKIIFLLLFSVCLLSESQEDNSEVSYNEARAYLDCYENFLIEVTTDIKNAEIEDIYKNAREIAGKAGFGDNSIKEGNLEKSIRESSKIICIYELWPETPKSFPAGDSRIFNLVPISSGIRSVMEEVISEIGDEVFSDKEWWEQKGKEIVEYLKLKVQIKRQDIRNKLER